MKPKPARKWKPLKGKRRAKQAQSRTAKVRKALRNGSTD